MRIFKGLVLVALLSLTVSHSAAYATTLNQIAASTFGTGGVGVVLIQLMLCAVVGWLLTYIASAVGQGQIAGMIRIATVFICISLVADTAWKAIKVVAAMAGIK